MVKISLLTTAAALCMSCTSAFVPIGLNAAPRQTTAISMNNDDGNVGKAFTSVLTAGFLLANLMVVDVAGAYTPDFGGSSDIVAARSGGRGGGRASSGRSSAGRSAMYSAPPSRTTIINRSSPIIVAPPVMGYGGGYGGGYGYGYNPFGGIGLGLGLNAVGGIGREIRESGQEAELRNNRSELEVTKQRAADLEARLQALESQQRLRPVQ